MTGKFKNATPEEVKTALAKHRSIMTGLNVGKVFDDPSPRSDFDEHNVWSKTQLGVK